MYREQFILEFTLKEGANMDTIVMKFGGSSVADNEKLKIVAQKIIDKYNDGNNIVVVVSAQRKNHR